MPSSVWSGHLTFGLISMPVRLFSGARSSGIGFNMLHRTDKSRLKQQYICQAEGVVVELPPLVWGNRLLPDDGLAPRGENRNPSEGDEVEVWFDGQRK